LVATLTVAFGCDGGPDGQPSGRGTDTHVPVALALASADTAGFARASDPREFRFPEDHGSHDEFRTEWWYVTGNVADPSGRAFGFQFTIFRYAVSPDTPEHTSAWATNQMYMGHFALTDIEAERFQAYERFERGALGLAGASSEPLRAWIGDWVLESVDGAAGFPMRVRASDRETAIDLTLSEGKNAVLHGEGGLSQKSPAPGNASYYYSHTRMPTEGTIVTGGDTLRVTGLSWLDREWSTSALAADQAGWDWFALQLDNGWELMAYQLRTLAGDSHPSSYVVAVDPNGEKVPLDWVRDFAIDPTGEWVSPVDGTVYPSGWRLRVLPLDWDLAVNPLHLDQELNLTVRYWEGAVRVAGSGEGGAPIQGRGYVELTGYGD
jgi:predicted secreted hydrolase